MTFPEITSIVAKVRYKSHHSFRTFERYEGLDVILDAFVPDSMNPSTHKVITLYRHIDPWLAPKLQRCDVIALVAALVREYELHEIDEWLRIEGECINDPHPEITS